MTVTTATPLTGDPAFVSFGFMADCCLAFTGEVTRLGDSLRLVYRVAENPPAASVIRNQNG